MDSCHRPAMVWMFAGAILWNLWFLIAKFKSLETEVWIVDQVWLSGLRSGLLNMPLKSSGLFGVMALI
jgi:hypothetical protein